MESRRLQLRPWTAADADVLFELASDPDVGPMAGWPPHSSVEHSRQVIDGIFVPGRTWAIVLRDTGDVTGCIGYYDSVSSNITIPENDIEVGYWVGRRYWNSGICTEALGLLLDSFGSDAGVGDVWADCFTENGASRRVLEKCGFEDTGATNECSRLYGGRDRKVHIFRLRRMTFRKATEADMDLVAWTVLEALNLPAEEPMTSEQRQVAAFFRMACSIPGTMYHYGNATIAQYGSQPVGCFISYDGAGYVPMKRRLTALGGPVAECMAANRDDEAVAGEYYLDSIAVVTDFRGRNVGRELIRQFISMARCMGFPRASLICDTSHPHLAAYYRSIGFEPERSIRLFRTDYTKMTIRP